MLDGMWVCDTYRSVSVSAFATDQKARFAWLEQAEKGVAGDATHIMGEPGCEFFRYVSEVTHSRFFFCKILAH